MAHRKSIGIRGASPRRKKKHKKSGKKRTIMGPDTDIKKFRVVVIESLPEGEIHTGTKLYEDELIPISNRDESFETSLYSLGTINEFEYAVKNIIRKLSGDELVALHVEAHGGEEKGIRLSSGEYLDWKEFMDLCRTLNVELGGLLIVTLAMCYSLPILGSVDPTKRAPFKAVLFTRRDVTVDEIERGYVTFYSQYRNPLDFFNAIEAMRDEVNDDHDSPYAYMVADTIFDMMTNSDRDPEGFKHIVNDNYCRLKAMNPEYTRERTEAEIRGFLNELAKNGKDYFTFRDVEMRKS